MRSRVLGRLDQTFAVSGLPTLLFTFTLIAIGFSGHALAVIRDGQIDPSYNPVPMVFGNGKVASSVWTTDGKLVLGGSFTTVSGRSSKNVVRLNSDGSFDPAFVLGTGPNDDVTSVFVQPDGKVLVSGYFTQFSGFARNRIARLNQDGSLDQTFNPNFGTSFVRVVALQNDGRLIVAGGFSTFGGSIRNGLVRLNSDGTLDPTFDPGVGFTNGAQVSVGLVQPDGNIVLGGLFRDFAGSPANGLIRLNSNGSLDSSFNASSIGEQVSEVFDFELTPAGKLYVVGVFNSVNERVYRLNPNGSRDQSFSVNHESNGRLYTVAEMPDGKVIVGGAFDGFNANNQFFLRKGLFRFNADGSPDTTFTAQLSTTSGDNGVFTLRLQSSARLFIGGRYTMVAGIRRGSVAVSDVNCNIDPSFSGALGTKAQVYALEVLTNGTMMAGGNFDSIGNSASQRVVRLNSDGSIDNSFVLDSQISGSIRALRTQTDGKTIIAGYSGVWRVDVSGAIDPSFNVSIPQFEQVNCMTLQADGRVLIGGNFTSVSGTNRPFFARLNTDGSVDSGFNVTFSGSQSPVAKVVVQGDGKILVGGNFGTVNGVINGNLARLNPDGTLDPTFNAGSGAAGTVNEIRTSSNGSILVGGNFSSFNGVTNRAIVRLESNGAVSEKFKSPDMSTPVNSIIEMPDGKLLISGAFFSAGSGEVRSYIARLFSDGTLDYSFNIGSVASGTTTANVYQIAKTGDNAIIALGFFDTMGGVSRAGVARISINNAVPRPIFDFDGDGKTDISVFRPTTGNWYVRNSSSSSFVVVNFGLAGDNLVASDYDGDFRTDMAVFRPSTGTWYIYESGQRSVKEVRFGLNGDIPAPEDYDGDGRSDIAVYRPSTGVWYVLRSSTGFSAFNFGIDGDRPVASDYDGDGVADAAVYRPSNGQWWINRSMAGLIVHTFGNANDKTAPGDWTGDRSSDPAIFRNSTGEWYVLRSENFSYYSFPFGLNEDVPVQGDYDGDGRFDAAIFRPSTNVWYINHSAGGVTIVAFGSNGDVPVPGSHPR